MSIGQIEETRKQYEDQLMELPNVIGVGIGEKNGKPAIKVFVNQKVPADSLTPAEIIPKQLNQYDVDVEEIGNVMADIP
ncbi:MAG TPA: hypothetical protein PLD20_27895 [Blastocatellia bacterium]|nr:hypothetical protein [Blastocatellia bacterium]HMV86086.1 hypothetical protein [Blastocatellia bacterium]HMX28980.1 hypothetical protein [Blastocatellia bacterium]HMY72350.1 hypothetical protein [Blastocatellia bacterium]HMZ21786.1 hypothetical protein [Blastocatellia bacterium]